MVYEIMKPAFAKLDSPLVLEMVYSYASDLKCRLKGVAVAGKKTETGEKSSQY